VVGRRSAARLDADSAAVRLDLHGECREVGADLIVVGADIGQAQVLVLGQHVGIPGQNRNAGILCRLKGHRHGSGVGHGHGNAIDLLGHEILHDLDLFVAAAVLAGADIHAFKGAVGFSLGLLAAITGLVEERVVHVLGNQREGELRLGPDGGHGKRPKGNRCGQ